jgi:hypothetical protein
MRLRDLCAVLRRNLGVAIHRGVGLLAFFCVSPERPRRLLARPFPNSEPSPSAERFIVPHARMSLDYPVNWQISTREQLVPRPVR